MLICSADALAAALLGAAVELAGHDPRFPQRDEPARAALRRIRPAVTFVDADDVESCSEEFVGPALMTGSRVIVFRSQHSERDVSAFVARMQLPVLELPGDAGRLGEYLK